MLSNLVKIYKVKVQIDSVTFKTFEIEAPSEKEAWSKAANIGIVTNVEEI